MYPFNATTAELNVTNITVILNGTKNDQYCKEVCTFAERVGGHPGEEVYFNITQFHLPELKSRERFQISIAAVNIRGMSDYSVPTNLDDGRGWIVSRPQTVDQFFRPAYPYDVPRHFSVRLQWNSTKGTLNYQTGGDQRDQIRYLIYGYILPNADGTG